FGNRREQVLVETKELFQVINRAGGYIFQNVLDELQVARTEYPSPVMLLNKRLFLSQSYEQRINYGGEPGGDDPRTDVISCPSRHYLFPRPRILHMVSTRCHSNPPSHSQRG